MRRRWRSCIVAATLIAALGSAAQAPASTVTIGSPLGTPTTFFSFQGEDTTIVSVSLSDSGLVRSPVDGRIVRWRVRGASAESGYAIRVIRPGTGELEFSGAGTSAPVAPAGPGVESFETSLPIEAGDYIGLDIPVGGQIGVFSESGTFVPFTPKLGEGEPRTGSSYPYEATFNADVELPPSVYLIDPASGPVGGGTSVAVAGDFHGVTAVHFGSLPAASFTVASEHRLTAVAPAAAAAGPVDVTVTTAAGTSAAGPDDVFTYVAAPQSQSTAPVGPSAQCTVPDLHGKKLRAAKREIRAAGCSVGRVRKTHGTTARVGRVTKQRPRPGAKVAAGTAVTITLG